MKKYFIVSGGLTLVLLLVGFLVTANTTLLNRNTIMVGTVLLFLIYLLSFFLIERKKKQNNSFQFVNAVSLATFLKLFLCIAFVLCYFLMFRKESNKADIFYLMGAYILYAIVETGALMKK